MVSVPRLVVAAARSGDGKTTVTTGLMAALRAAGHEVAPFKVGPDYIDPGYHALATGRPGRNLDAFLCGTERLGPLLRHGLEHPRPADLAVIEGVMGLFDGRIGTRGESSTAAVATALAAPVILVIDVAHSSRTPAAVVHGLATYDPAVRIGGVIANRVGSARHLAEVTDALQGTGVPLLGALPRDAEISAPSRHLGLVPVAERDQSGAQIARLGELVAAHLDLDAVLEVARGAPDLDVPAWDPTAEVGPPAGWSPAQGRPVVAIAGGRAFTFRYAETEELLRAAGCEPVVVDPLTDPRLPPGTCGLYLGGGFPEVYAAELAANRSLQADVADAVAAGLPTVAECAGMLYLARELDGVPMVGALPMTAAMHPRLTLGYQEGIAPTDHLLAQAGERVRGHAFHRTRTEPAASDPGAWVFGGAADGFASPDLTASYLHIHLAGHPRLAQRFCDRVHRFSTAGGRGSGASGASASVTSAPVEPDAPVEPSYDEVTESVDRDVDLDHHGDADLVPGAVDLAVNVRLAAPPEWLAAVIHGCVDTLGAYPDAGPARAALADFHGLSPDHVLPTSGAAEAFTLIARALAPERAVIVHPQFTEPETALRRAGHVPLRHLLPRARGFSLDASAVPDGDLVIVGNPTNPTGVLHPAAELRRLIRPGRVVVVDEAFVDAVPGERESLIPGDLTGVLVLRSLTKTWGLAGLRAGYVVGDPALVARLAEQQPPWSVSTPALAAMVACTSPQAREEAGRAARDLADRRAVLVAALTDAGFPPAVPSSAPFVLVDTAPAVTATPAPATASAPPHATADTPGSARAGLLARGFAVRRGDTFPGLGPTWIRLAVRDPQTSRAVAAALADWRAQARRA